MITYDQLRRFRRTTEPGTLAKYTAMLADSIIPTVKVNGMKFFCPAYIPYWRAADFYIKEPNLIEYIRTRPERVFWDIGANVGVYSIFAALRGMRVYSFEPNPANYFLLSKNIVLNGLEDMITAYPFAVGYGKTMRSKTMCEYGEADKVEHINSGLELPVFSPVQIVDKFGTPSPEFLKVDVDGTELDVLREIFDKKTGETVTFASVEHDNKDERKWYMKWKGFKCIKEDYVNSYYERADDENKGA